MFFTSDRPLCLSLKHRKTAAGHPAGTAKKARGVRHPLAPFGPQCHRTAHGRAASPGSMYWIGPRFWISNLIFAISIAGRRPARGGWRTITRDDRCRATRTHLNLVWKCRLPASKSVSDPSYRTFSPLIAGPPVTKKRFDSTPLRRS